ncbi:Glucose--fructose oxidoreductase [Kibdelosporangium sp. 4NS15]|uniref:Glucose--fructose oxidoreductase n=2 Tax=Kibdelosporangium persicum TaxID=2698649 RepID=A0ABX2FHY3_9PSEU|nr:Glucose--fructose oxidoreductase [Kibdelosporangium persicum]
MIAAVASRDLAKAERFTRLFGGHPVTGYQALLDRHDVDAVYIPLPTGAHAEWAHRALEAGKHVLVEKPLAGTEKEVVELAGRARDLGLRLHENRMFQHHSQHRAVGELVTGGEIGGLRVLSSSMAIPPLRPEDVRYQPKLGGGALLDVGYYPIHAALMYLSGPVELLGARLVVLRTSEVDVRGHVLLGAADGVTAQLTFGFDHAYRSSYELWGDHGRIELDRAFTPPPEHTPCVRIHQQDRELRLTLPADDQFRNSINDFVSAVRRDAPDTEHIHPAIQAAALMDAIRHRADVSWIGEQEIR